MILDINVAVTKTYFTHVPVFRDMTLMKHSLWDKDYVLFWCNTLISYLKNLSRIDPLVVRDLPQFLLTLLKLLEEINFETNKQQEV